MKVMWKITFHSIHSLFAYVIASVSLWEIFMTAEANFLLVERHVVRLRRTRDDSTDCSKSSIDNLFIKILIS
jgi:hypothetical protein